MPNAEPITHKRQLVEYLEAGCKSRGQWRIGTEHEKFAFRQDDLTPVPYGEAAANGGTGIRAILEGMQAFSWEPILEDGLPVALKKDGATITLEPGGQFELSGATLKTLHQTCNEVHEHLAQVKEVAGALGVGLLGIGFHPTARRDDIPWMPKGRYGIMKAYMPTKGALGLDMMLRTTTVQVNLDFESESCMVRKFRTGLALQPISTALFANSPFMEGKPVGFLSYRSHIWTDTDPDRCGILPFVFEDGMGFERYVDYMLDVPMYFVYRDGKYIDAAGQSFRDFMAGRLPALPGEAPVMADWLDHLTTVFPEVRLKQFLEMRGADGGPARRICALPAFWVGLLYDQGALDAAWDLVKGWSRQDHEYLRAEVPRRALATPFQGRTVGDLALEVLEISREGLRGRQYKDQAGRDETRHLDTLMEIANARRTSAEDLLEAFKTRWDGSIDPVFEELAY